MFWRARDSLLRSPSSFIGPDAYAKSEELWMARSVREWPDFCFARFRCSRFFFFEYNLLIRVLKSGFSLRCGLFVRNICSDTPSKSESCSSEDCRFFIDLPSRRPASPFFTSGLDVN